MNTNTFKIFGAVLDSKPVFEKKVGKWVGRIHTMHEPDKGNAHAFGSITGADGSNYAFVEDKGHGRGAVFTEDYATAFELLVEKAKFQENDNE